MTSEVVVQETYDPNYARAANEREFQMIYRSLGVLNLKDPEQIRKYCAGAKRLTQLVDEWETQP